MAQRWAAQPETEDRAVLFTREVQDTLVSQLTRNVWDSVANFAQEQKYAIMQQGAWDVGIDDWQCDAIPTLLGPQVPVSEVPGLMEGRSHGR